MSNYGRKCIKNMQHEWETVEEYPSHIVKQCLRCHVEHYKYRNVDIKPTRFVPIRI